MECQYTKPNTFILRSYLVSCGQTLFLHRGIITYSTSASHGPLTLKTITCYEQKIGAGYVRLVPSCHTSALSKVLHLFSDTSHFLQKITFTEKLDFL